jgi:VRR-NUC domain
LKQKITEKKIESLMLDWLNAQKGIFAFKVNTVGIYDTEKQVYRKNRNPHVHLGTPDILCCAWGLFIAIEVKKPGNKATDHQKLFLKTVSHKGFGFAICVSSLEALMGYIESIKNQKQ